MAQVRRRLVSRPFEEVSSSNGVDYVIEENTNLNHSQMLFPITGFIIIVIWSITVMSIGLYFNDKLPNSYHPISVSKYEFNTDNVLQDLKILASFGPKVTGSQANEYDAVNFLSKRIYDIKNESLPIHSITYDLQKVSGKFPLHIFSSNHVITYENIQNVIVKIGPKQPSNHSLLINCHFDSVPTSPGASDDGLNCAVMLEILRILSITNMKLPYNIIFLFNGAEENPLIGSHGFITNHKWADEVKAFINLESCGAGGREVLFQAAPNHPWLIKAYGSAAKYPSGQVIAEEIFQSGLIPSDTDFRIFRDFGNLPGLDFAHCKNGYVYHTKFDNIDSIESPHGVIKHTGENILALSKELLNAEEFIDPNRYGSGKQVYFDLLGLIFIHYPDYVGIFLNAATSFLSLWGIYVSIKNLQSGNIFGTILILLTALASMLTSLIIANSYNLFIAITLDFLGYAMSWYRNTWLVIFIYAIPVVLTMIINIIVVEKLVMGNINISAKVQLSCLSVQLLWTILLFSSSFLNVRSSFLLLLIVLPCSMWTLNTSLLDWNFEEGKYAVKVWHLLFILVSSISSCMLCYLGITSLRLFIPIAGRMGVSKNPELLISLLTTLLSVGVFSYISTFFVHVKQKWTVVKLLFGLYLLSFFVIISPFGFPFSVEKPQRVLVTHVNRQFFDSRFSVENSDSLFWIQNVERRGRKVLPFLNDTQLLDEFCKKDGYCGLPWFTKLKEPSGSTCIPSSPHQLKDILNLEVISNQLNENEFYLEFRISGSDHMGLIITPSENVTLLSWNMPSSLEQSSNTVAFVQGLHNSSHTIILEAVKASPDSFIKVELYGLYFHHSEYYTQPFHNLLLKFPKWSHVSPALAMYNSYIF